MATSNPVNLILPPRLLPDFSELPWEYPLNDWSKYCQYLVEVSRGLSRHPVEFVNLNGVIYAIKEMQPGLAEIEYNHLLALEKMRLPSVKAVGHAVSNPFSGERSILITRYLDQSLPYRSLFMSRSLSGYRDHLLDAMAGLLVQLHLSGVYWGDCSLSNTLFRRDAGALQAYLVDAETVERNPGQLAPTLRHHDLQIMEENVAGDLGDLSAQNLLMDGIPLDDTSASIRIRYQNLWEEITRQIFVTPDEKYRIHERIQAINSLGFSIGEVLLEPGESGDKLSFQVVVTDRSFHRDQLLGLTGIEAEEMQARTMMNEIQELKATLSHTHNRSTPLSLAAYNWLHDFYLPTLTRLQPLIDRAGDSAELYCQVLVHKWYLSEAAQHDVGHQAAVEDYMQTINPS
ncbi:MAG TPA: DUF4032 domain-containing protein [Anaerolineales bacterium]|nr:DUF4032 domain-containing protein [Anaerolineales bacterium]